MLLFTRIQDALRHLQDYQLRTYKSKYCFCSAKSHWFFYWWWASGLVSRYNNYTIILPFWLLMNVIKMKLKCCLPIDDTPDCQTCSWCCMVTSKVIYYCSNSLLYTEVPCLAAMSTDSGNHSSGSYSPTSWTIYTNSCIFSSTGRYILLSIGAPNSMCLDKNMR